MFTEHDEAEGMNFIVGTMSIGDYLKYNQEGKDEVLGICCRNSNSRIKFFKNHGYGSVGKLCLGP